MNYVHHSKKLALLSACIVIVALIVGIFAGGLKLGIDFTGGSIITIDIGGEFDLAVVQQAVTDAGETGFSAMKASGAGSQVQSVAELRVHLRENEEADAVQRETILNNIKVSYPEATQLNVERVGASASWSLIRNAFLSVLLAGALILVYVSFRFQFYSALAAVSCLLHDVIIMISMVCILRLEINSSFIASVLTIVGYSINNTIVLFDRVRDNQKVVPGTPVLALINEATAQTLTRSLYTALTTVLTIGCLYLFGAPAIRAFALPIIVGLVAGTYSSLFLAGPFWGYLDQRATKKKKALAHTSRQALPAGMERQKTAKPPVKTVKPSSPAAKPKAATPTPANKAGKSKKK